MRFGTIVKIAALALVALTVAMVAAVKSFDVDEYRALLVREVEAATGRELVIGGPLQLEMSLTPTIVATDVSLANAEWGSQPVMARAKRIEAHVSLLPLLGGEVQIRRLVVVEPDLLLERDAQGRGNWEVSAIDPEGAEPRAEAPLPSFRFERLRIEKANIAYRDGATFRNAVIERLTMETDAATAPVALTVVGSIEGRRFDGSGVLGSSNDLHHQSRPFPVKLRLNSGGLILAADGGIADMAALRGVDLRMTFEGTELSEAARIAGYDLPQSGPFRSSFRVQRPENAWQIVEIDGALGKRDLGTLSVKGAVADVADLTGLDMTFSFETTDLSRLSALAGSPLPAVGPIKLSTRVTGAPEGWRLGELKLGLGSTTMTGSALLDLSEEKPRLVGDFTAPLIDTADFLRRPSRSAEVGGEGSRPVVDGTALGRLVAGDPVPVESLRGLDADLAVSTEQLVVADMSAQRALFRLSLRDGLLTLLELEATALSERSDINSMKGTLGN
ncbi:AsmA family protein [Telmatospirillum sp. J64-1]|uniref:AsmA family protein n=1 Tax=Telmatospirillum sp. J64-1 TaxID=2502183 RepID=UPI00115DCB0C|nr:AsmA family protein [Telmatospirillum sp. J64-1]